MCLCSVKSLVDALGLGGLLGGLLQFSTPQLGTPAFAVTSCAKCVTLTEAMCLADGAARCKMLIDMTIVTAALALL